MARKISTETRQDLLQAVGERYRGSLKDEKLRILDEFVAVTGYHRKHVIRLFNAASDRVCGKRLRPLLPLLVSALERHGHLTLHVTVRARVLSASAATLDRMLRPTRASVSGQRVRRRAWAVPSAQKKVPVRTFAEREEPLPGDMEADLVSHGGDSAAGRFVHTLTLTDVASGWTECVALVVRAGALVAAALEQLRRTMPFPLRGFDTDNGGEFMNETVAAYCHTHGCWPRRGNTASRATIAGLPGPRVIGGRARIRSSARGRMYARGSRPNPTASVESSDGAPLIWRRIAVAHRRPILRQTQFLPDRIAGTTTRG